MTKRPLFSFFFSRASPCLANSTPPTLPLQKKHPRSVLFLSQSLAGKGGRKRARSGRVCVRREVLASMRIVQSGGIWKRRRGEGNYRSVFLQRAQLADKENGRKINVGKRNSPIPRQVLPFPIKLRNYRITCLLLGVCDRVSPPVNPTPCIFRIDSAAVVRPPSLVGIPTSLFFTHNAYSASAFVTIFTICRSRILA